jgi:UDP-2,3-diacylglucosamine pyrophosphatase LpxH
LLDFLKHNDADIIYLVGDIIDGWQLKRGWYWPQSHNDVLQKFYVRRVKALKKFMFQETMTGFAREYRHVFWRH